MNTDMPALVESTAKGGTLFSYLPIGARFVFNAEDADKPFCVLVKTRNGYRHEIGGRQWKTGARTTCYRLSERAT